MASPPIFDVMMQMGHQNGELSASHQRPNTLSKLILPWEGPLSAPAALSCPEQTQHRRVDPAPAPLLTTPPSPPPTPPRAPPYTPPQPRQQRPCKQSSGQSPVYRSPRFLWHLFVLLMLLQLQKRLSLALVVLSTAEVQAALPRSD